MQELFTDLFAYVLLLEHALLQQEDTPTYTQVRKDIAALLERQQEGAKCHGILEHDYHAACFAVLAWADETILQYPTWPHHAAWNASPLQLEYYQTRNAGEELFARLEHLRPEQHAVREIYYLCLGLGFSGQYFLGLEDTLQLTQIRHEQAQQLSKPVEPIVQLDKITAQPYAVAAPSGKPITSPLTHSLLQAGLALLIMIPLGLFGAYKFWSLPSPATLSPSVVTAAELQQQLAGHPCTQVAVALQTHGVGLSGWVASEAQRAEVRQRVYTLTGVTQVTDTLQLVPPLLCEVVHLLSPLHQAGMAAGLNLGAQLNKSASAPVYRSGEDFAVTVKTPTPFPSYVYVEYYSADGTVIHLWPNPQETPQRVGRDRTLTVHQMAGNPLEIQAPFGLELVTVVASKTPLFTTPRAVREETETYLRALRQALLYNGARSVEMAATFAFLTTRQDELSP
jgi:type IV/VI secretion system ImpK/VasF family protein